VLAETRSRIGSLSADIKTVRSPRGVFLAGSRCGKTEGVGALEMPLI
jgi:hypothetical protein